MKQLQSFTNESSVRCYGVFQSMITFFAKPGLFIWSICEKGTLSRSRMSFSRVVFSYPAAYRAVHRFAYAHYSTIFGRSLTFAPNNIQSGWLSPDTLQCLRANSQNLAVCPHTCLFTHTSSLTSTRREPLGWRMCVCNHFHVYHWR